MVATSGASPLKLASPKTTEVITDAARSNARIIWNIRHVRQTGRDVTTTGNCNVAVTSFQGNSPVLIGGIDVYQTRGHIGSLDVLNKRKSTYPIVSRNTHKFDASVDGNLANDGDSTFIFIKVIGRELPHSPRADIYLRCQMDFMSNAVVKEAPTFVYLGLPVVNALDELNTFGTPATIVIRPKDDPIGMRRIMFLDKLQRLE